MFIQKSDPFRVAPDEHVTFVFRPVDDMRVSRLIIPEEAATKLLLKELTIGPARETLLFDDGPIPGVAFIREAVKLAFVDHTCQPHQEIRIMLYNASNEEAMAECEIEWEPA